MTIRNAYIQFCLENGNILTAFNSLSTNKSAENLLLISADVGDLSSLFSTMAGIIFSLINHETLWLKLSPFWSLAFFFKQK